MKTAYEIPRVSAKLKRSTTPYTCNGETVYIFRDREDGTVCVSRTSNFEEVFDVAKDDIKPFHKIGSTISSKPKKLTLEEIADKDDLNAFYDAMIANMPFACEECNKPLYAYTKKAQRTVCAHILPKAQFESVKTHPLNIFYLGDDIVAGVCNHHSEWDRLGVDHRKTMRIYPEALRRFKTLATFLTDKELVAACDYLGIDWEVYK